MCDASEHAASYVFLTEHYTDTAGGPRNSNWRIAFGTRSFKKGKILLNTNAQDFSARYFAFAKFGHFLWGVKKTLTVMTDGKDVYRIFQAKQIPPKL